MCARYQITFGNQIKKTEMRGACSTYGGEKRCIQWGNLWEGDHLKERGVDGRMILKWILEKWDGDMDWIDVSG